MSPTSLTASGRRCNVVTSGGPRRSTGGCRLCTKSCCEVGRMNPQPSTWYSNAVTAGIEAGQDRGTRLLLGARGQIPNALWGLIYFGAGLMAVFAVFFHVESRHQLIWMTVAVVVMLTVLTGVLAGLDHPSQRPFGVGPNAMRVLQVRLADVLGLRGTNPLEFCRTVPTAPAP